VLVEIDLHIRLAAQNLLDQLYRELLELFLDPSEQTACIANSFPKVKSIRFVLGYRQRNLDTPGSAVGSLSEKACLNAMPALLYKRL
jgi:hypothetical protein